jgi:hypothetical protein
MLAAGATERQEGAAAQVSAPRGGRTWRPPHAHQVPQAPGHRRAGGSTTACPASACPARTTAWGGARPLEFLAAAITSAWRRLRLAFGAVARAAQVDVEVVVVPHHGRSFSSGRGRRRPRGTSPS